MEKDVKDAIREVSEFNIKKGILLLIIMALVGVIIFGVYFLFFYSKVCSTVSCFTSAMHDCDRATFLKQDSNADWVYQIKGDSSENSCNVKITLLKIKQGSIDSEGLQGKTMTCNLLKGDNQYPEKDLSRCTGSLKEELQDLIIQRMHKYILDNLGKVEEGFSEI